MTGDILESINSMHEGTLMSHLGIEFIDIGENYLTAKMPVDERTCQPLGLLHGGASAALAETLGSVGSAIRLDLNQQAPVGLELNANHIRPVTNGYVTGTATPLLRNSATISSRNFHFAKYLIPHSLCSVQLSCKHFPI